MRYAKMFSVFLLLLWVKGCAYVYSSYTTKLDAPIVRNPHKPRTVSSLDVFNAGKQSASIGDSLFRVSRYRVGEYEIVKFKAPIGGDPFPQKASWAGTHVYNDQKSGDLIVFTTPAYYKGTVGVILDASGNVATKAPIVQLDGPKKGRRWTLNGNGPFFDESWTLDDKWAIRYGGKVGDQYIFEIVKEVESSTSEMLQSIKISEAAFFEGFTVRGVFIKGLSGDDKGLIKHSVVDNLIDKQ